MRVNKEYEVEISLKDLLFEILYHWRSCLLAAVILAILLGGARYALNLREINAYSLEETSESLESTNAANYQESADLYTRLLRGYENYRNRSILMQADPYQIWTVNAVYYIKSAAPQDGNDPADAAVYTYASAVYNELDPDQLSEIYGNLDINYLEELIVVEFDLDADCFSLKVKGLTSEMAEKAFAYVDGNLQNYSTAHADILPEHQLFQLTKYISAVTDTELEKQQVTMAGNISKYISSQSSSSETAESMISEVVVPHPFHSVRKYTLLGFLVGGFLAVCFYAVRYLLSDRLHHVRDLSEAYGLPLYSEFAHSRARHPGKGIDSLLEKWEFGGAQNNSNDQYDEIQSLLIEKHSNQRIMLTGTVPDKKLTSLAETLRKKCGTACELNSQPDFLRNKSAIQTCSNADAVILVEEKGVSSNREIARMIDMLMICKANVEGVIII